MIVMFTRRRCCTLCGPVEKYLLKVKCSYVMANKKNLYGLIIFLSSEKKLSLIKWSFPHFPTLCIYFLCRAGYLTLFGGEQNNNGTDPSKVYEEYRKFDGLLTKMARGTLKRGTNGSLTTAQKLNAPTELEDVTHYISRHHVILFVFVTVSHTNVLWHHQSMLCQLYFCGFHGEFHFLSNCFLSIWRSDCVFWGLLRFTVHHHCPLQTDNDLTCIYSCLHTPYFPRPRLPLCTVLLYIITSVPPILHSEVSQLQYYCLRPPVAPVIPVSYWNIVLLPPFVYIYVYSLMWHVIQQSDWAQLPLFSLWLTFSLPFWCLSVCDRWEEDSPDCSAETVGAFGSSRYDWGLGVKPLASRLQATPAGGGDWWGDAEEGCTDATMGHTGEWDVRRVAWCTKRSFQLSIRTRD